MRIALAIIITVALVQTSIASTGETASASILSARYECMADPAYAPGGANVGDCLSDRAAKIESRTDAALHQASKMLCDAQTRDVLRDVQATWRIYRDKFCSLAESSPGNMSAYINAAACRLLSAQQRLDAVLIIGKRTYERCLALSLQAAASRFGAPSTQTVKHSDSALSWKHVPKTNEIEIHNDGRKILGIDTSGCSYCQGDAACSEGVFLFQYLAATREEPHLRNHGLLHACSRQDGVTLTYAVDLENTPKIVIQASGLKPIDWSIDYDTLTITSSDGASRSWKAPQNLGGPEE